MHCTAFLHIEAFGITACKCERVGIPQVYLGLDNARRCIGRVYIELCPLWAGQGWMRKQQQGHDCRAGL